MCRRRCWSRPVARRSSARRPEVRRLGRGRTSLSRAPRPGRPCRPGGDPIPGPVPRGRCSFGRPMRCDIPS
jgi:hypothetical protein